MKETLDVLVSEVRTELGNPLVTELSDSSITQAINDAVSEYSRLKGYKTAKQYSVPISKDIDTYDVASEVTDITEVVFMDYTEWSMYMPIDWPEFNLS